MHMRSAKSASLIIVTIGLLACGKEDRKTETAEAEAMEEQHAAAEAEEKKRALAELAKGQHSLDLKFKSTEERLEKQGNKTKRKLKPRFDSLEAEKAEVASGLDRLREQSYPGFIGTSDAIRVRQDSLSKSLTALEKAMK